MAQNAKEGQHISIVVLENLASQCNGEGLFDVDLDKNRLALEVIWHIIAHSCWLNIHVVQHHGAVFEIRVPEGYGARWSKDGTKFIGFLEPYMEDGHSKKWRH
ncbi:hypothetical protein Ancab_039321 [Ancistrocladus abbreviatus]